MVTGTKWALPLAASSSTPTARGPLLTWRFLAYWANSGTQAPSVSPQMTADTALRYNRVRQLIGEGPMEMPIEINDKAPEFTSLDQNGEKISLKDYKGKWVVLYFYPRADTPGCTIEACGFRDSFRKIEKTGAIVLGVSPDQPKAQKKFEEKYDLPFTLVADADKTICNAYGVIQEKNMYGKKVMGVARTTFIIGPDGKIRHIFRKVKPEGHADEVLEYLKEAQKSVA
jgi:thioredoxin-dependent peroxiredoxin